MAGSKGLLKCTVRLGRILLGLGYSGDLNLHHVKLKVCVCVRVCACVCVRAYLTALRACKSVLAGSGSTPYDWGHTCSRDQVEAVPLGLFAKDVLVYTVRTLLLSAIWRKSETVLESIVYGSFPPSKEYNSVSVSFTKTDVLFPFVLATI